MSEQLNHEQWTGKTAGMRWMHRALIASMRVLPLWFVYAGLAVFVVPSCMLFAHKGYIAMYHFFRQRFGFGVLKSFWYVYRNHYRFGQIIIDRFANYAGKQFDFDLEGYDHYQQLANQDAGFLLFSSHVGNYELAGYAFTAREKRFNALVFSEEAEEVMSNRNRLLSKNNIRMIPIREDLSHVFQINNALSDGEIVSMPADRIFGSPKYVDCQFFNATARFPYGPFALATRKNLSALALFVMKVGLRRYKVYIRPIETPHENTRDASVSAMAQTFAGEVEKIIRQYPDQWFNYYEFWQ